MGEHAEGDGEDHGKGDYTKKKVENAKKHLLESDDLLQTLQETFSKILTEFGEDPSKLPAVAESEKDKEHKEGNAEEDGEKHDDEDHDDKEDKDDEEREGDDDAEDEGDEEPEDEDEEGLRKGKDKAKGKKKSKKD